MKKLLFNILIPAVLLATSCSGLSLLDSPYPKTPGECPEVQIYETGDEGKMHSENKNLKTVRMEISESRTDDMIRKQACELGATHAYKVSETSTFFYYKENTEQ